jgi:hypothetical protein
VNAVYGFQKIKYQGLRIRLEAPTDDIETRMSINSLLAFIDMECNRVGILPYLVHRILFTETKKMDKKKYGK